MNHPNTTPPGASDATPDRDPVEALAEEFMERQRRGENPAITEYIEKHPALADEIRDLFPALLLMENLGVKSKSGSLGSRSAGALPTAQELRHLGDYRLLREIGRGGMGIVYEAEQESLGRRVALKVLPHHSMLTPTQLERFRREAQAAARLHHSNIVPVFEVGEQDGIHFYAMQFIHGQSLDKVIDELKRLKGDEAPVKAGDAKGGGSSDRMTQITGSLLDGSFDAQWSGPRRPESPPAPASGSSLDGAPGSQQFRLHSRKEMASSGADTSSTSLLLGSGARSPSATSTQSHYFRCAARLGMQVAAALSYANSEGILHRDIKPSNLLLDTRGNIWVTDFGLAKAVGSDTLTQGGDILGTLAYMAPERFKGWSDPRGDLYSLGLTLYEIITLRRVFEDGDRHQLLKRIETEEPVRPRRHERHIPMDLETIILKSIEKEAGKRYPTASDMADDLRRFLDGEPIRARKSHMLDRAVKWARRRPAVATAAFAALLLLASLGLLLKGYLAGLHREKSARYDRIVLDAISRIQAGSEPEGAGVEHAEEPAERGGASPESSSAALRRKLKPDLGLGSAHEAVRLLDGAVAIFPERADARFYRAQGLRLLNRNDEAADDLARLLRERPDFAPARFLGLEILDRLGLQPAGPYETFRESAEVGTAAWQADWVEWQRAALAKSWSRVDAACGKLLALENAAAEPFLGFALVVRLARGRARLELRDFDGALEDFAAARARFPQISQPALEIGEVYLQKGQPERAETAFQAGAAASSEPGRFAADVSRVYSRLEKFPPALAWAERVPRSAEGARARGTALQGLVRFREAEQAFLAAAALEPGDPRDAVSLGDIAWLLGKFNEVEGHFRRGLSLDPKSIPTHMKLIFHYHGEHEFEKEEEAIQAAKKIVPERDIDNRIRLLAQQGMMLLETHRLPAVRDVLAEGQQLARSSGIEHPFLRNLQGHLLFHEENYIVSAEDDLGSYRRDPHNRTTQNNLEISLNQHLIKVRVQEPGADAARGLKVIQEALAVRPEGFPGLLRLLAEYQLFLGNIPEAVRALERLPNLNARMKDFLEASRQRLLPELVSFESADWLADRTAVGSDAERRLLEGAAAAGQASSERRAIQAYLVGRLLERSGKGAEASQLFLEAAAYDERKASILLARCLRAAGQPRLALLWLRRAGQGELSVTHAELRRLWGQLALIDLQLGPREALAEVPQELRVAWSELVDSLQELVSLGVERLPEDMVRLDPEDLPGRLESLALEARYPGLWTDLRDLVQGEHLMQTASAGGTGGGPFKDVPGEGGLLKGLEVTWITNSGVSLIASVKPIYMTGKGKLGGSRNGTTNEAKLLIQGRPGYAIGALEVLDDLQSQGITMNGRPVGLKVINACRAVFMKIDGLKLNPGDSYKSEWAGQKVPETEFQGRVRLLTGNGAAILGVGGYSGLLIDGLTLFSAASVLRSLPSLDREIDKPMVLLLDGSIQLTYRGGGVPPPDWKELECNEREWKAGSSASSADPATDIYMRQLFELAAVPPAAGVEFEFASYQEFTAYLNGQEIAAPRIADPGTWLSREVRSHSRQFNEDLEWRMLFRQEVDPGLLRPGKNVLALVCRKTAGDTKNPRISQSPLLIARLAPGRELENPRLARIRSSLDADAPERLFIDARILQRAGRQSEAAELFNALVKREPSQPEAQLRLAESLAALGRNEEAAGKLSAALRSGVPDMRLWEELVRIEIGPLERPASEVIQVLDSLPDCPGRQAMLFYVNLLDGKHTVRLACGSNAGSGGVEPVWLADSFFAGSSAPGLGQALLQKSLQDVERLVYHRWFYSNGRERSPAYRLPLLRGRYRVALRFAERNMDRPGDRMFNVYLEGEQVLFAYWPPVPQPITDDQSYVIPDSRTFEVEVRDGILDIETLSLIDNAMITALEIEPLARATGAPAPRSPGAEYIENLTLAVRCLQLARRSNDHLKLPESEKFARAAVAGFEKVLASGGDRQQTLTFIEDSIRQLSEACKLQGKHEDAAAAIRRLREYEDGQPPARSAAEGIDRALEAPETLVAEGSVWKFFRGIAEPPSSWNQKGFDDAAWETGPSGFGFGDGDDNTLLADMKNSYSTVYIRREVAIADPRGYTGFLLAVKADDAFVAFLNGREICRQTAGPPGTPVHYQSLGSGFAQEPLTDWNILIPPGDLHAGSNLLALVGINHTLHSSDVSLIPVLLADPRVDAAVDRARVERARLAPSGETQGPAWPPAPWEETYLEARVRQRGGDLPGAASLFQDAMRAGCGAGEAVLHRAECLLGLGRGEEALPELEQALQRRLEPAEPLGRLWYAIFAARPGQTAASLQAARSALEQASAPGANAYLDDLGWALERLIADGAVRLNAGGDGYRDAGGRIWGRDRFFRSGYRDFGDVINGVKRGNERPYIDDVGGTEDDPLYTNMRWFYQALHGVPGYEIPLPPGRYRVTLHFAEISIGIPGMRSFNVLLEGREVLSHYEPLKDAQDAVAKKSFDVDAAGGFLDIEFVAVASNPMISALEIERIDGN